MKTLGVIGGMGPAATAHFYNMFVSCCNAGSDQEHPDTIILSLPSIPDRTAFILGKSTASPLPRLNEAADALAKLGAGLIAIPCVTAHFFYDDMAKRLDIPILHMIKETAASLSRDGIKRAGLLATAGTVTSGIFQRKLTERGVETITPPPDMQDRLMSGLYAELKAGKPMNMDVFYEASDYLRGNGAEALVLGCTELSLVCRDHNLDGAYVDAMRILARRAAEMCCR